MTNTPSPLPDLAGAWTRLRQHEDEHGQAQTGHGQAHEQAYHDVVEAVYTLADQGRLQSILDFTREDLEPCERRMLTWDVVSLASRMEVLVEEGVVGSTRLFAIPLSGPSGGMDQLHQADGFGALVGSSPQFPKDADVALLGVASIEAAASMSADTLARLTRVLDEALGSGDMSILTSVVPILDRLMLHEVAQDEADTMRHGVIIGACRHVETLDAMTDEDALEGADPELDQAWVDGFTQWCEQHPQHAEQPWMSSPPAKWEAALVDAVVQRVLMELAIMATPEGGCEEMPRAAFYHVFEDAHGTVVEGRLPSGLRMGAVRLGPETAWLLPKAIEEWRSWGCQVEVQATPKTVMRPRRMH